MKKVGLVFLFGVMTILLSYCTPKVGKEISKTNEPFDLASFSNEDLALGHQLMNANCAKCHKLHDPKHFSSKDWEGILKAMLPKAKLEGREGALVKAYILKNAQN